MVLQAEQTISRTGRRIALAMLAVAVYLFMWLGWKLGWTWVTTPDAVLLDVAQRAANEQRGWVFAWNVLCTIFSPVAFRVVTLGFIVFILVRRPREFPGRLDSVNQRRTAVFLFLAVEMSAVLTEVAKRLADRPRPVTAMVHALGTSFPSGHALGTMVAVLALWVVFAPQLRPSLRPWVIAAGVSVVVLVGVGRVALNVHHPSDVLAGWALGYLYFLVCLPVLRRRDPVTSSNKRPVGPGTAR